MVTKLKSLLAAASLAGLAAGCATASAKPAQPRTVAVSVTSDGFQPAEIKTKAGEPLRLVVTRTTDRTCAKEIVIKDLGIDRPLPLNQAVSIDVTPKKNGQLRYACSMDMVAGTIVVE